MEVRGAGYAYALEGLGHGLANVMLERSKGIDLIVGSDVSHLPPDSPRMLFLKEVISKHASRIRELDIYGIEPSAIATLFEDLPRSSLRLRSLELKRYTRTEGLPTFPGSILNTSDLQYLQIYNCEGPWYSLSFPALTTLKLEGIHRPTLVRFLETLRGLPALTVLAMDDPLPIADESVADPIRPVNLPNLRRLELFSNNPKDVVNILPLIIVPPTTTLEIFCSPRGLPEMELRTTQEIEVILDQLAESFSTFFGQRRDLSYNTLCIRSRLEGRLCLEAGKDGIFFPAFRLILQLGWPKYLSYPSQDMLQRIFPSLTFFNSINTLTLDIFPTHKLLEDTFGFPHLQNVKVIGKCTSELIQALSGKLENDPFPILFPALQCLWIERYSFNKIGGCTAEDLQGVLKERCSRGVKFLTLRLTCGIILPIKDLEIREVVNDIEWVGVTSEWGRIVNI